VWTLPKEVEETFRQALQEKNGVAHQQEQQKEEKEKEIPAEIQQKTQAEGESEQHADESNRHDADQVPIERESAVQARSEMEMESSEDHMTKVRIALAERYHIISFSSRLFPAQSPSLQGSRRREAKAERC